MTSASSMVLADMLKQKVITLGKKMLGDLQNMCMV
jgi:hypothetical protein